MSKRTKDTPDEIRQKFLDADAALKAHYDKMPPMFTAKLNISRRFQKWDFQLGFLQVERSWRLLSAMNCGAVKIRWDATPPRAESL